MSREIENLKLDCRKQGEVIAQLRGKHGDLQALLNNLIAVEGERTAEHRAAVEDLRGLSKYTTAKRSSKRSNASRKQG